MEKTKRLDQRAVMISELIQGMELAKQLRSQIDQNAANHTSNDVDQSQLNYSLLDKMLSSFDKTISLAKLINIDNQTPSNSNNLQFESSNYSLGFSSSPRSQNSHHHLHLPKKRKTMPRVIKKVQVHPGESVSGLEGPLDDGFSWRKYGQKDILGAKFPRGYYRCTHRHSQGCGATKQVQRSDEDPSIYLVNYRGQHTCIQGAHLAQAQIQPIPAQIKPEPQSLPPTPPQDVYLGLGPDGTLEVDQEENESPAHLFRSFSFTPALIETGPIDNYCFSSCSPVFGSPTTSESNYFSVSPYRVTGFGTGLNVRMPDSDFNEAGSGPSSVSNSPTVGEFEFHIDDLFDIENIPFEF